MGRGRIGGVGVAMGPMGINRFVPHAIEKTFVQHNADNKILATEYKQQGSCLRGPHSSNN